MSKLGPSQIPWKLVLALLGAIALLLMPWHPNQSEGWIPLVWDWGHAPLFFGLAWLLMRTLLRRGISLLHAVIGTFSIAALLAGVSELAQHWTGRSGQWSDFLTDILGIGAGLCFAAAFEVLSKRRMKALGLSAGGMAIFLCSAHPLLQRGWISLNNSVAFPLLADFESNASTSLWRLEYNGKDELLLLGRAPDASRGLLLKIPASGLTSLHHDTQGRDWRAYQRLMFDYELAAPKSLSMGLRIDGAVGIAPYPARLETRLEPGRHTATIPLPISLDSSPQVWSSVGKIVLFFMDPGSEATLCIDRLRLAP